MEDRKYFFDELHDIQHLNKITGGSRASGYIKKLLAMHKEGLEVFDIKKMKYASDHLKQFGILIDEEEDLNQAGTRVRYNFGSTVQEQVDNIKETLYGLHEPFDKQKQAVEKALEILKYKENHIIQEARKPLQRELIIALNDIKNRPTFRQNYLPSPTGSNTGHRIIDRTDLAAEIPVFEKSVVEIVEEEVKKQKRQEKKESKQRMEKSDEETRERLKKEKEEESLVNKEAIMQKYGKNPETDLFYKMAFVGIKDPIDYDSKDKGIKEIGYSGKELAYTYPGFWTNFESYLNDEYDSVFLRRNGITKEEYDQILLGKEKKNENIPVNKIVKPVDESVRDEHGRLLYMKSALEKLDSEIKEAEKKANDYLKEKQEIESTKSTKALSKWQGAFTKKEAQEADEINKLIAGKKLLASDPLAKEYIKKMKALEARALKGVHERSAKLRQLRQDLDDLVRNKLIMTGVIKPEEEDTENDISNSNILSHDATMNFFKIYENRTKPAPPAKVAEVKTDENPDEDFRAKLGYKDTQYQSGTSIVLDEFNRNSQVPKGYTKEQGFAWLKSKWGDLYQEALNKLKEVARKSRPSWNSKDYKEFIRLPFKDGKQMIEFWKDVLVPDPAIYHNLHINAHSTKAPSLTSAFSEFKKWADKR